jgi:hypothetical protein
MSLPMKLALNACIFYSVFSEPIRLMGFTASYDIGFNIISIFVVILFSLEIFFLIKIDAKYLLSYMFWIDTFSLLIMIYDF